MKSFFSCSEDFYLKRLNMSKFGKRGQTFVHIWPVKNGHSTKHRKTTQRYSTVTSSHTPVHQVSSFDQEHARQKQFLLTRALTSTHFLMTSRVMLLNSLELPQDKAAFPLPQSVFKDNTLTMFSYLIHTCICFVNLSERWLSQARASKARLEFIFPALALRITQISAASTAPILKKIFFIQSHPHASSALRSPSSHTLKETEERQGRSDRDNDRAGHSLVHRYHVGTEIDS